MNSQLIQQGRAAYRAGDFSAAAQMLGAAKTPDEIMGEADHLRGNALMHLGMYAEAAEAYAAALNDGTYGKRGALLTNRGKALAREEILDAVWGKGYFGELKIVDVNIRRLRMKVEDEPSHPTHIMTVWGYGYRWEE